MIAVLALALAGCGNPASVSRVPALPPASYELESVNDLSLPAGWRFCTATAGRLDILPGQHFRVSVACMAEKAGGVLVLRDSGTVLPIKADLFALAGLDTAALGRLYVRPAGSGLSAFSGFGTMAWRQH